MGAFQRIAAVANSVVRPFVLSPRWGRFVEGRMTVITYTGRRSGRVFSLPVAYKRQGDDVTIKVEFPDQKTWWRNFLDHDGPVSLHLQGVEHRGTATSTRDSRGQVSVDITLAPAS